MDIEIVDLPTTIWCYSIVKLVYQRVPAGNPTLKDYPLVMTNITMA